MSIALGYYRHFKGGLYTVFSSARMASVLSDIDGVEVVIYANCEGEIFVRPEIEFFDVIAPERVDGREGVLRFTWVDPDDVKSTPEAE